VIVANQKLNIITFTFFPDLNMAENLQTNVDSLNPLQEPIHELNGKPNGGLNGKLNHLLNLPDFPELPKLIRIKLAYQE
jgi:hypothetical protein